MGGYCGVATRKGGKAMHATQEINTTCSHLGPTLGNAKSFNLEMCL